MNLILVGKHVCKIIHSFNNVSTYNTIACSTDISDVCLCLHVNSN